MKQKYRDKIKENRGITIVALVVTIVVLLILASISIQGITKTGIFSSAESVKTEHKRALISTTLQTKLKINQSEQIRGTDEEVIRAAYEDVKNDLEEIKKAGGKDIEVSEVTSEEKNGKTEWFFEVKVDGDVYKVALDGSDYLGKEDELAPLIQIKTAKATTNTIFVTVTTRRNEGGKIEYYIKEKGTSKFNLAKATDQNEYTYTGLKQDTTFVIKAVAIGKNGKEKESKEVEIETSTVPKIDSKEIEFAVEPNTWTNKSVKVTAKPKVDTQGFTLVTSKNPTSSWTKVNNQTFSTNGTMYVALTDGNNYGVTASHEVTNIDKIKPVITGVTATTNTIKITATDEASGICAYAISESSTMPTKFTVVDSTKIFNKIIENKKQSTKYYVWVKDQAGNVSEVASTTTGTVAGLTDANTTFSKTPNDWTNKDVTVTASTTEKNFALQTKKDNGEWQTTGTQTFTENGTIYARLWDGINAGAETKLNVTNIDKLAPNAFTPKATVTTNSIKVDGTTTDATATSTNGSSGIKEYRFSKDGGKTYTNAQTSATYTFSGLTQNVEYTIVVEAKDNAGNTTTGTVKATTGTVPTASGATYTPTTWTKGSVTVTLPTKSGYSTVYTTNGTVPTISSTKYSSAFAVSTNCKINYLFTDGTNIGGVGTVNVTNIDTTAPTFVSGEVKNLTTTGYDVYVYGITDTQSGVNRVQFPTWTNANGQDDIQSNWWEPSNTVARGTKQADGTTWVYHVNIKDHKNEVGLYYTHVYIYDNLGNSRCVFTPQITVPKVPDITSANASFSYNPNTWTSGSVRATTSTTVSGYYLQTSTDAQTWKTQNYVDRTTNGAVYARLTDGVNVGNYVTGNVGNIDKIAPTTPTLTAKIGNDSGSAYTSGAWTNQAVIITATSSDTQSQINRIEYSYDNSTWNTNWGTSLITSGNNKSIKGTWGTNYNTTVYVRAVDNAGNVSGTASIVVRHDTTAPATPTITAKVGSDSGSAYTSGSWTSQPIIITATSSDTQSQINRIEYSYNNSSWSTSWGTDLTTNGNSKSIKGTWNGNYNNTVYVRAVDNVGNVSASSSIVIREDATAPTIKTGISGTATSKSITLSLVASDNLSGVNKIVWYYKDSTASSYTSATDTYTATTAQTTRTHTFTGLTQNKTYNAYAVVYDAVGRTTQSSTINVSTLQVPNLATTNGKFTYSTTNWTNGNVTATASTITGGYSIQTSTDASNWSTNASISRSSNGKVYARLWDGKNAGGYLTGNISNIDKTNISISSFTASPSSTIATVATLSTTVNDANSGLSTIVWQWGTTTNYGSSSTSTYTTKNGATAGTTGAVTKTFSLTGLSASTTYYVKMTAYDVAGNANTSTTSFTTGKAVAQVGSVYYTSVQNAINSATNDATVKQLVDQTESVLIEENKSIKLNTNGKKLQGTKEDNTVTNKGKLTINGNGTITSLNQVVINNTGNLTLDEGSIIAGAAGHHVVENYNLFNMNGGYIELTIKQITCSVFNYKGTFIMKGGKIDSEGHALVSRGGKAEINGKNITITGKNSSHRCMYADENGTINVKEATIVGTVGYENGSNFGYLTFEDCNMAGVSAIYGRTFETISGADGYRVLVYDSGNWLTQVRLPTWTVNGGQDDIVWHDASKGKRCNTTAWYYDIKKSQHKNESGTYITHIYCYKNGNLVYSAALAGQNVK